MNSLHKLIVIKMNVETNQSNVCESGPINIVGLKTTVNFGKIANFFLHSFFSVCYTGHECPVKTPTTAAGCTFLKARSYPDLLRSTHGQKDFAVDQTLVVDHRLLSAREVY